MNEGIFHRLMKQIRKPKKRQSFLRYVMSGGLSKPSNMFGDSDISDIHNLIQAMRNLANDSQISTALSYYATDSTIPNSSGDIIWATSSDADLAKLINELFKRLKVNNYARDHILEIATIGNMYMPTTDLYKELGDMITQHGVVLDNNTIVDNDYDLVPVGDIITYTIDSGTKEGRQKLQGLTLEEAQKLVETLALRKYKCNTFVGDTHVTYLLSEDGKRILSITIDGQPGKYKMMSK